MTDPRAAFLRAIEQDFDSDTPRLVFADWLDEHGEPDRAEYIRLHCELTALRGRSSYTTPSPADRERSDRLYKRYNELNVAHREQWLAAVEPRERVQVNVGCGFPVVSHINGEQLITNGWAIRESAVIAGRLTVHHMPEWVEAFVESEHLTAVTHLRLFGNEFADDGIYMLTASRQLRRLRGLTFMPDLFQNPLLTDAAPRAIADTERLPALDQLEFDCFTTFSTDAWRCLLESPQRSSLTRFTMSGRLNADGSHNHDTSGPELAELFRSPNLRVTQLTALELHRREVGDDGAAVLAACPALAGLIELDLISNGLTDTGAAALLTSPHLRQVRVLNLERNAGIGDATARAILADARPWKAIRLYETGVTDSQKAAIQAHCEAHR